MKEMLAFAWDYLRFWLMMLAFYLGLLALGSCAMVRVETPTATMPALLEATLTPMPACTATPEPVRKASETPKAKCRVSTGYSSGQLHLRACAGIDCPIIAYLQEAEPVTVLVLGDWLQVNTSKDLVGWVNGKYVECQH